MDSLLPFIPAALLVLACPLMMGAMGVGAWLVARARGEKRALSMGCMPGHGEHQQQPAGQDEGSRLREGVARLEQEVQALRAHVKATASADELVVIPGNAERLGR